MADDKYRLLFEASADAIFLTAPDGTIFDANPAATEMFGLSRDEFCRGGRDAILVRDAAFSRALEQRERIGRTSSELTYRRKDGSVFVGETMSVMLPPEGGQTRAFAVVRDVTARRRAEDALRERNEYIEAILEQAPIGFAVHTLDGVARFVSRRFEAIYGVPAGSILSLEDYFDKVYRDPAFREEIRERMVTDVAAGDPARMRWEHLPIVSESGERRYVTAVNIPLPERNLMVATVQDVTAHVMAEMEVARLARLYSALSAVDQAIVRVRSRDELFGEVCRALVDFGGFQMAWVGSVNPSTSRVDVVAQAGDTTGYLDGVVVYTDDRPEGRGPTGSAIREGRPYVCNDFQNDPNTAAWRDRAMTAGWRASAAFPITLGGGVVGALMVYAKERGVFGGREVELLVETATDVSVALDHLERDRHREHLEAQLVQAQRMEAVGRLAGGVAHDFNNMLSVIVGHAEMALLTAGGRAVREDLNEIRAAARKSADLTRQLRAFARRQTIQPQVLDLNEPVGGMLKMLRRLIGEDVELQWSPGAGAGHVRIDPSQLDQVLANLVVNARDAMSGTGRLRIETGRVLVDEAFAESHRSRIVPGDYVRISVADTGAGMTAEVLEHAFEPFFTTKPLGQGTGLGLSTVYGIVSQNEGFIDVESEPDEGTTILIWLRRVEADEVAVSSAPERAPRGDETLLIVEDSEAILRVAGTMLSRLGYQVLTARTPAEAVQTAEANRGQIDLLVTDVIMPEMNGKELAVRLVADQPRLKCLFMSGYTADVIAHHGVLDPAVQFLQKPFSIATLAVRVREALDGESGPPLG
jgi:PAS domain S-box-containing protein